MRAQLVAKNGCVYLHDLDTKSDIIVLTATEAGWLSHFLQQHLTSELIVQLRLAAHHSARFVYESEGVVSEKIFPLQRS